MCVNRGCRDFYKDFNGENNMAIRTINHPDVEITEFDQTLTVPSPTDTACLIMGFANSGEDHLPIDLSSIQTFLNYFGQPETDAEMYFYEACRDVLTQGGRVTAAKIPYDNYAQGYYRAIPYTLDDGILSGLASALLSSNNTNSGLSAVQNILGSSAAGVVRIITQTGTSAVTRITETEMEALRSSNEIPGSLSIYDPSFVIVDKSRSRESGNDENNGLFVVLLPAYNALARQHLGGMVNTAVSALTDSTQISSNPYAAWSIFKGINSYSGISGGSYTSTNWTSDTDWVLPPTAPIKSSSISKSLGGEFPIITNLPNGTIDPYYLDQIVVLVCKSYNDPNKDNLLSFSVVEKFIGSLDPAAKNPSTGQSIFLGTAINDVSDYIEFYFNTEHDGRLISTSQDAVYSIVSQATINAAATVNVVAETITWPILSFTDSQTAREITYSKIYNGITRIFEQRKNIDSYQVDIVVDAGLSNIAQWVYNHGNGSTPIAYTPSVYDASDDSVDSSTDIEQWKAICAKLIEFSQNVRKDCISIIDAPRALTLKGNQKAINPAGINTSVDVDLLPKLPYLSGLTSSYGAGYLTWLKIVNPFSGNIMWIPETCRAAGIFCFTDKQFNYWDAPAGLDHGIINNIVDISVVLDGPQADEVYGRGFNYARQYPYEGFTVEGQKTLLLKESAFSRINVRRAFLRLERMTYKVARYFVYQINNYFTRTRLVDLLTPAFDEIKIKGGLNDFKIICDETNNTSQVLENHELKVAVLIKPSIAAEFIRASFVATKESANFEEVIIPA